VIFKKKEKTTREIKVSLLSIMRENKKKRTFVACLIELEADVK